MHLPTMLRLPNTSKQNLMLMPLPIWFNQMHHSLLHVMEELDSPSTKKKMIRRLLNLKPPQELPMSLPSSSRTTISRRVFQSLDSQPQPHLTNSLTLSGDQQHKLVSVSKIKLSLLVTVFPALLMIQLRKATPTMSKKHVLLMASTSASTSSKLMLITNSD